MALIQNLSRAQSNDTSLHRGHWCIHERDDSRTEELIVSTEISFSNLRVNMSCQSSVMGLMNWKMDLMGYDTQKAPAWEQPLLKWFIRTKSELLKSSGKGFCDYEKNEKVCKQSNNHHCKCKLSTQAEKSSMSHYKLSVRASLRSVNLDHFSVILAVQTHSFIQNQVINHQGCLTLSLPLSLFSFFSFISRLAMWQDFGQVVVQVCSLIQNDRWLLSLLPGDSVLAGLRVRASCTWGRRGTGQEPWLRRGQCLQCIVKLFVYERRSPTVLHIYHVCLGHQTFNRQEKGER